MPIGPKKHFKKVGLMALRSCPIFLNNKIMLAPMKQFFCLDQQNPNQGKFEEYLPHLENKILISGRSLNR